MTAVVTRLRAHLELARVSNLPTCVTNVLVGVAGAAGAAGEATGGAVPSIDWRAAGAAATAVVLMYVSGMALNDVVDTDFDRTARPERPIPSGRISRREAAAFAAVTMAAALVIVAAMVPTALPWAGALAVAIVLYDLLHKRHAAAAALMGVCRTLVYLLGAAAVSSPGIPAGHDVLLPATAMGAYIVGVTLVARREHLAEQRPPYLAAVLLATIVFGPVLVLGGGVLGAGNVVGVLVCAAVVVFAPAYARLRPPTGPRLIMLWLAAICLADAAFLLLLGQPVLTWVAVILFFITRAAQRAVMGS